MGEGPRPPFFCLDVGFCAAWLRLSSRLNIKIENRKSIATSSSLMIRKLPGGEYRLYSKKKDPKTGKRKNLGTFKTRAEAEKHERAVQYFKRA